MGSRMQSEVRSSEEAFPAREALQGMYLKMRVEAGLRELILLARGADVVPPPLLGLGLDQSFDLRLRFVHGVVHHHGGRH